MTDKLTITGIVVDRQHKDGVTAEGKHWDRYGFQIAGKEGKHWYSSFDTASWDTMQKGQCYEIYYSEKENPSGGAPFRNVEWWAEVEMTPTTAASAAQAAKEATNQNDVRRSAQEMRLLQCLLIEATRTAGKGTRDGVWEGALTYYDWVSDWEVERRATIQDGPSDATEAAEPSEGLNPSQRPTPSEMDGAEPYRTIPPEVMMVMGQCGLATQEDLERQVLKQPWDKFLVRGTPEQAINLINLWYNRPAIYR